MAGLNRKRTEQHRRENWKAQPTGSRATQRLDVANGETPGLALALGVVWWNICSLEHLCYSICMVRRGNRNAVQTGLWAAKLSKAELALLEELSHRQDDDLAEETALLRLCIRIAGSLIGSEGDPPRVGSADPRIVLDSVGLGVERLAKVLRAKRVLTGESAESLTAAFAVAIREIGEELGIDNIV